MLYLSKGPKGHLMKKTNFVDLESLMHHAKFQDHQTSGSEEDS